MGQSKEFGGRILQGCCDALCDPLEMGTEVKGGCSKSAAELGLRLRGSTGRSRGRGEGLQLAHLCPCPVWPVGSQGLSAGVGAGKSRGKDLLDTLEVGAGKREAAVLQSWR